MTTETTPKTTSHGRAEDPYVDHDASRTGNILDQTTGRKPDASVAFANIRVSGWLSPDKGWTFVASRSYRDHAGVTKYSEMTLFVRDLLPLATALQAMAQNMIRQDNNLDEATIERS